MYTERMNTTADIKEKVINAVLDDVDAVNIICGVSGSYNVMGLIEKRGMKGLYTYNDRQGHFEWNREEVEKIGKEKVLKLYKELKHINDKQEKGEAVAIVLNNSHTKRAFYRCSRCGKEEISTGDKFCPMCGIKLMYQNEEQ